jgi:RNA polymerase sigma factor (sigma-70 family)
MSSGNETPWEARSVAGRFQTTNWSAVLAAGDTSVPEARESLEKLCRTYWYPLYAYIRSLPHSPEAAQDLTQGFFVYVLQSRLISKADPEAGRFRSFLLTSLKHFLAHERERATALKRGGGTFILSFDQLDPEQRCALEPADPATPEQIYDRRWAMQQLENALARLKADYDSSDRGALFDLLKDYIWGDKNTLTLAEIATRLDLTEEAVKKSVQRMRQRFRDCLRGEIAQTVATPQQIDDELRHLRAALAL